MKYRVFFLSLLFALPFNCLIAQQMPTLLVQDPVTQVQVPLAVEEIRINVKVIGNIAVTTSEYVFYNGNDRVYEGQFYFPLGEGQTVSRFALDINGKMREGVVVEKDKGRQVFETVVRQNIDPGLLEWTKGNNFKARVYPIPAKGTRTVLVAYEQELTDAGKGFLYTLPLNYDKKVKKFSVNVEVLKQDLEPELENNQIENFKFEKWQESYVAKANFEEYLPDKQIAFMLPKPPDRQKVFMEQAAGKPGQYYFYVNIDPRTKSAPKTLPKTICLLWDVSSSTAKRDIARELELLDAYFTAIRNLSVQLVTFSNDIHSSENFSVSGGDWAALRNRLEIMTYDGGTQLGCLDLTKYSCDEYILASDGLSNFGKSEIKTGKVPVMVINSNTSAEHSYLNYIASATGGAYINLAKLDRNQAYAMLSGSVYSFISATFDNNVVQQSYPTVITPIVKDFAFAGIMNGETAEITLNFGFGNRIEYSKKITISKDRHLTDCGLIRRIWGQKKIAELDMNYKKNEAEITALAKEMSIVTRNTSLIVLERIEDYVKNRIVPPADLLEEYNAAINKIEVEKKETEKTHIDEVVAKFEERKAWWNTVFKFGKPEKQKHKKRSAENDSLGGDGDDGYTESPAPEDEEGTRLSMEHRTSRAMAGAPPEAMMDKKEDAAPEGTEGSITLKKWEPDTPYLKILKDAPESQWVTKYLEQKKEYASSSAFFLDVADFFMDKGKKDLALRVLSNIAEMELENHALLRILGYRLKQLGYYKLAICVFEEVLKIRNEEPQSYRDLALALQADKQYASAADRFYHVVKTKWDDRFPDVELIAVNELNAMIATCGERIDTKDYDSRLLFNMPVDIRVILTWDADLTDMDLWVTDPNGEKCFYSNNKTYIGAIMSRDFTRGYGPEEFLLKRAQPGKYKIEVNYYGNTQQVIAGATTIQVMLTTGFGTGKEKTKEITMRLKDQKEVIEVGEFEFK